jgi:hypothetical protein
VTAAVAGDAGGNADELAADGRAAGFRVGGPASVPAARVRLWQMAAQARGARRRGWTVRSLPGAHLHQTVDPAGVARLLLELPGLPRP